MARRKPKPSYVLEMSLKTSPQDERRLQFGLFEAAKRINNALLQEGLEIVQSVRTDPSWDLARKMPRATKEQREARGDAFRAVRMAHGFSDFHFQALAIQLKNDAGFAGRVGANVTQKLGTKVFHALEQHLLGVRGKPRFKGVQRPLHSVEDKTNAAALRWNEDDGCVYVDASWCIQVNLPDLKRDEWFWHALQAPVKYCRVLWRMVRGERKYFVQLVMDGQVPMKQSLRSRLAAEGTKGGIDIGPSTIGWCTETDAGLFKFCAEVEQPAKLIRVLQRKIDRQRRANNPDNFDEAGRAKRGKKWVRSTRQIVTETTLRSLQTHQAEVRANAHGRDINKLLEQARGYRHDGVSIKSLQKNYGTSVGARAPGRFMSELQRKAESAGGGSSEINVRQLKTSQYDHTAVDTAGAFVKKKLSERWHHFGDGRGRVQRDVYSAFLALHPTNSTEVDKDGKERTTWSHDPAALEAAWSVLEPALRAKKLFHSKEDASAELTNRACIPRSRGSYQSKSSKVRPVKGRSGTSRPLSSSREERSWKLRSGFEASASNAPVSKGTPLLDAELVPMG